MNKAIKKLWESATFTEWTVKLIKPLRLLLVTPLILTQFSLSEQAAWYLFASIGFFGQIVTSRVNLTFSRMISMANGGAINLSPIKEKRNIVVSTEKTTNWKGVLRVYNTITMLIVLIVVLIFVINSSIGYFTLREICRGITSEEAKIIWISFIIMRMGDFIGQAATPPAVALTGLNHVALVNRWTTIFQFISVIAGYIVLMMGVGMIGLTIVMQSVVVVGLFRNYWLTRIVNEGRLWKGWKPKWDKEVFAWAWQPLWKGFIAEFAKSGVLHMTGIIFAFYASTAGLASYLFSVGIARTIQSFSMAPFSSQMPRFAKMMAQNKLKELRMVFNKRVALAQFLLCCGFIAVSLVGPLLLTLIESENTFLPVLQWLSLGGLFLYERFNTYCLAICAAGNNIVLVWSQVLAGASAIGLMFFLIPHLEVWGILISLALPALVVMNIRPFYKMKSQLSSC